MVCGGVGVFVLYLSFCDFVVFFYVYIGNHLDIIAQAGCGSVMLEQIRLTDNSD